MTSHLMRRLGAIAIFIPALLMSGCSAFGVIDTFTPNNTYTRTADIAYGPDQRNRLDVYVPLKPSAHMPIVLFIYGGSWAGGAKQDYRFVGEALASRGILAVVADYRIYPQVSYPSFIQDTAAALDWTYRHAASYGGDLDQLYMMGHSSGAYNVAMVALDHRWLDKYGLNAGILRGWIGLAGPYNFLPIQDPQVKLIFHDPNTPLDSQPINHVSAAAPPSLLLVSRKDNEVEPVQNTERLAQRLQEAGAVTQVIYFDHTSHASLIGAMAKPLRGLAPVLDTVDAYVHSDGSQKAAAEAAAK